MPKRNIYIYIVTDVINSNRNEKLAHQITQKSVAIKHPFRSSVAME